MPNAADVPCRALQPVYSKSLDRLIALATQSAGFTRRDLLQEISRTVRTMRALEMCS